MILSLLSLLLVVESLVSAQNGLTTWTISPLNAPSFPLAVKTPYMNIWEPHGNGPQPASESWPIVGSIYTPIEWASIIVVDGIPYQINGVAAARMSFANQVAVTITPTRTSFLFEAGPVLVNATYLSPVMPNDIIQQSLPFSYYYLTFTSNSTHAITVYSDIIAEWVGGDRNLPSNCSASGDSTVAILQAQLTELGPFQELDERPMDGIVHHAMLNRSGVSWQCGDVNALRGAVVNGTVLSRTDDSNPQPSFLVGLGIAADLGTIQSTSDPIVWAVGVVRDPAIQFKQSNGLLEDRRAYYWSNFSSIHNAIVEFLDNFDNALYNAIALDNQILADGSKISTEYYDLLALSTRQAMGAIDFTVGEDSSGNWNLSDVKAFLRNAGGVGSGGVNAVDVIYAASPIYLYLNPEILGYLLRPLLEYQESSLYTNPYAAIDIGANYSMATGNNKEHDEGIEQTGSMLIMTYAHAQRTGDTSLLSQHYDLLRGWANYLVNNSLAPESQRPSFSDGISAVNQTNLALKGIIGIGAMARISSAVNQEIDAEHYQTIASAYAQQWRTLAFSTDQSHFTAQYGQDNTFSLLYNLYAHKLLQLDLFPDSDFVTQTAFYKSQLSQSQYGLSLDSSNASMTRSDWMMFTAGFASDNTLRDELIAMLHAYASVVTQTQPFVVVYNPITGVQITGASSSAQGAMFALLALNTPVKLGMPGGKPINKRRSVHTGAVIGGGVGGVGAATAVGIFFYSRNRHARMQRTRRQLIDPLVLPHDQSQLSPILSQHTQTHRIAQHIPSVPVLHNVLSFLNYPQSIGALREKQRHMIGDPDTGVRVPAPDTPGPSSSANVAHGSDGIQQTDVPDLRRVLEDMRRNLELVVMRQEQEPLQEAPPLYDDHLDGRSGN